MGGMFGDDDDDGCYAAPTMCYKSAAPAAAPVMA